MLNISQLKIDDHHQHNENDPQDLFLQWMALKETQGLNNKPAHLKAITTKLIANSGRTAPDTLSKLALWRKAWGKPEEETGLNQIMADALIYSVFIDLILQTGLHEFASKEDMELINQLLDEDAQDQGF